MKAYWGSGGIAPRIDFGTTWMWLVSFTSRPLYPWGKSPCYPMSRRLGGPQNRCGHGGEENNSQPLSGIEHPTIQPVAQPYTTELSRFLFHRCAVSKMGVSTEGLNCNMVLAGRACRTAQEMWRRMWSVKELLVENEKTMSSCLTSHKTCVLKFKHSVLFLRVTGVNWMRSEFDGVCQQGAGISVRVSRAKIWSGMPLS
jgi:hypothetical protein